MRKNRYDVVVVGCGPGGAVAGRFAALNGADTLIIEQKRQLGFPIHDYMAILYSQSEMEETTGVRIDPEAIYSRADGIYYISPSGREGKPQLLTDGILVNRQLLEKSLAIAAVRAGAEIMLHARVVGLVIEQGAVKGVLVRNGTITETIHCSLVIGADGTYQRTARDAGISFPPRAASAAIGAEFAGVKRLGTTGEGRLVDIYLGDFAPGFYGAVVPYSEDRVSLGISYLPNFAKNTISIKQRLANFIRHLELLGKYDFSKASPVLMTGAGTAGAGAPSKLASDGIMLVGDAAGRPAVGCRWGTSGMIQAAWTGRAVGEIAAGAIAGRQVGGAVLEEEYKRILQDSLKQEGPRVKEAARIWRQVVGLGCEDQDRAVVDVGREIAAMHFYMKGALPLRSCLEPVQDWLKNR